MRIEPVCDRVASGPRTTDDRRRIAGRGRVLREKELRIALVCFGGVSLAIYMHGISKEILKLVRASRALHAHRGPLPARAGRLLRLRRRSDPEHDAEHDTEAGLFRAAARDRPQLELRVIVDIIAGASAGGINGTMLARALEPRSADGGAARALARQRRCRRPALGRGAGAAAGASGSCSRCSGAPRDRQVPDRSPIWRCGRNCRCSCARAGSGRRSTGA